MVARVHEFVRDSENMPNEMNYKRVKGEIVEENE